MTDSSNILSLIISMFAIAIVSIIPARKNLPRNERYKQFAVPIIAAMYVIIVCFATNTVIDIARTFVLVVAGILQALSEISWIPLGLANAFSSSSTSVAGVINSDNSAVYTFFIANTIIIIAFFIVKLIALSIIKRYVKDEGHALSGFAGVCYEYSTEVSKWILKEEYISTRIFLKSIYRVIFILVVLLCGVSMILYSHGVRFAVFYPVLSLLIIGELYFFINGVTKHETENTIYGESEESRHYADYTPVRKYLRKLFTDKLLSENTSTSSEAFGSVTNDEIISAMIDDENQVISTFGEYLRNLDAEGGELDYTYVKSTKDLLDGKSILFNNPFYNDLIPYVFYPMNRTILKHRKVLVILGRHSIENDIKEWIKKGIGSVTHIPDIWNIGILNEQKQELDVGIITRSDVYNLQMHDMNAAFLGEVEFIVVIEPSKLISTAQIGLNLLVNKINTDSKKEITYCITDKNCDGLVDAISHVLQTSIIEVAATNRHKGTASYMCWEADDDYTQHRIVPNISRYLGFGTELSFAALKNQVAKTIWYGGETFPVIDMAWIVRQYYYDLMKYANLPANQKIMGEHFRTSANFWGSTSEENSYIVVEDETYNMFEILREFSTRSKEQGFVNIISSEYLLKDYMSYNADIFVADSKAIPNIVADYVRSSRNICLRIILLMSTFPMGESDLSKELSLLGVELFNIRQQLWYEIYRCYSSVNDIITLSDNYETAVKEASSRTINLMGNEFSIDVIETGEKLNFKLSMMEKTYLITDTRFISVCVRNLRSAAYIAEDEKGHTSYLGSELTDQIYSKYLPGQFIVYGGKYYEMQYLTADDKVLLRRAADHISGRLSYRQIRNYCICGVRPSKQIGAYKDIAGFKIKKEFADIIVATPGYYRMLKHNDFTTAKKIVFEGDVNRIPDKQYSNKEILMIEFPDYGHKFNENIKYTITVLLNEVFRTLFDENQVFISAVTDTSTLEGDITPLTYTLSGDGYTLGKNVIYIIEDSQLDLGLIEAVERNIERIFQILTDYLDWHFETIDNSLNPKKDTSEVIIMPVAKETGEGNISEKAKLRIGEKIKNQIKRHESETKEITMSVNAETNVKHTGSAGSIEKKPYHLRHFMLFGSDKMPVNLRIQETFDFFKENRFDKNELKEARANDDVAKRIAESYIPNRNGSRYCDFCGIELYGVEYETLVDGRDRCMNCGRTAVKTADELNKLFNTVKNNMESFYGIRFKGGINVEMVNAKKLHKKLGHAFVPTNKYDGRIIGVAIKSGNELTLMIENGSPKLSAVMAMVHELTHIWQYQNWDQKGIKLKYGSDLEIEIYEGMAKWVEIQYAYNINEIAIASREEIITSKRNDEYGRGFLRYKSQYSISKSVELKDITPFTNIKTPLDSQYCGNIERVEEY